MSDNRRVDLMAAAIYEIRILLASYLGSENDANSDVRLAAHLAYALHNEAENLLTGNGDFDIESALSKIRGAEKVTGEVIGDGFKVLKDY